MYTYNIGNRIYEKRKEKGLSQKELGALLGVSNKAVSKWETGASLPKTETLVRLSEVLDTSVQELLSGKTEDAQTLEQLSFKTEALIISEELDKIKTETAAKRVQKARQYLTGVISLFAVFTVIFILIPVIGKAGLGFAANDYLVIEFDDASLLNIVLESVGMSYAICGIFTGIVWAVRIYKRNRRIWAIIVCCILFPITYFSVCVGGLIMVLPTIIISFRDILAYKENKNG